MWSFSVFRNKKTVSVRLLTSDVTGIALVKVTNKWTPILLNQAASSYMQLLTDLFFEIISEDGLLTPSCWAPLTFLVFLPILS
jgi:hypothetical protein